MMSEHQESIQLLNTAVIKSKESKIDSSYEERLATACSMPVIEALGIAAAHLAEKEKISRDQAAIQIVEAIRELDAIWNDYIMVEGLNNLKNVLKNRSAH